MVLDLQTVESTELANPKLIIASDDDDITDGDEKDEELDEDLLDDEKIDDEDEDEKI
ncbi:MAG: hypothetical protein Q7R62_02200 [bacterium]|nr:hypothetical protein [bacterium]